MARIVHLAIKIDDLEKATAFYQNFLGFKVVETSSKRGHTSRHLTDGTFDLALIKYDSEDMPEARLAGEGPRIHHFGMEVPAADMAHYCEELRKAGCDILSDPGVVPIKFRAPGGTIAEIGPPEAYPR